MGNGSSSVGVINYNLLTLPNDMLYECFNRHFSVTELARIAIVSKKFKETMELLVTMRLATFETTEIRMLSLYAATRFLGKGVESLSGIGSLCKATKLVLDVDKKQKGRMKEACCCDDMTREGFNALHENTRRQITSVRYVGPQNPNQGLSSESLQDIHERLAVFPNLTELGLSPFMVASWMAVPGIRPQLALLPPEITVIFLEGEAEVAGIEKTMEFTHPEEDPLNFSLISPEQCSNLREIKMKECPRNETHLRALCLLPQEIREGITKIDFSLLDIYEDGLLEDFLDHFPNLTHIEFDRAYMLRGIGNRHSTDEMLKVIADHCKKLTYFYCHLDGFTLRGLNFLEEAQKDNPDFAIDLVGDSAGYFQLKYWCKKLRPFEEDEAIEEDEPAEDAEPVDATDFSIISHYCPILTQIDFYEGLPENLNELLTLSGPVRNQIKTITSSNPINAQDMETLQQFFPYLRKVYVACRLCMNKD